MRLRPTVILLACALGLSACGSAGSEAASRPSPPSPVVLSVYVGASAVHVSPARLGAGPVLLTVANESSGSIELVVSRGARGLVRTAPINPQGDTQLKLDLVRGDYRLAAVPGGRRTDAQKTLPSRIAAASLHVGHERPSSGSQLLQP